MNKEGKILIVEDDLNLGFLLMELLQQHGYSIRLCRNGLRAIEWLKKEVFDLCIFDIVMPEMNGFDLAKNLKDIAPNTPFFFLTARVLKEDKLKGYGLGAEDYITKPFDEEELICKIEVVLRRSESSFEQITKFDIGSYTFDVTRMELIHENDVTRLTEKESEVLKALCINKNQILRRDQAVERIYGKKDYFHGRSFDVFISKLRKLLKKDPNIEIQNVFKVGFILNVNEKV